MGGDGNLLDNRHPVYMLSDHLATLTAMESHLEKENMSLESNISRFRQNGLCLKFLSAIPVCCEKAEECGH